MTLRNKLKKAFGRKKANVFLWADLFDLGSEAQLSRALRNLVDEGASANINLARSDIAATEMRDRSEPGEVR